MKRAHFLAVFLFIFSVNNISAQPLPRRVFLGIRMSNLTADALHLMNLSIDHGILIEGIIPGSTAEAAGFKTGDILYSINDSSFHSTSEVIQYLGSQITGRKFSYAIYRDKKLRKGISIFTAIPEEKYPGIEMIYTEAKTTLGQERLIISKPSGKPGKLPAILFIGGIGCYSLDSPFDTTRSEIQLLNTLSRAGYLCARAEKPGVGDNIHTLKSCSDISLTEELEGYLQMIRELKNRPDVDSGSVYIFGHSMGGVFAPMIAQRTKIRGIISYGTIGSSMPEYLVKTRRTIAEAYGMDPEAAEYLVKDFSECAVFYFTEKLTSQQADQKKPGCGELVSVFDARSRSYNDELYALNIASLWKPVEARVLLLHGTSDFISSESDHLLITNTVNFYHPGNAVYQSVENCDHGMLTAKDFPESLSHPGPYNPWVAGEILAWLSKN